MIRRRSLPIAAAAAIVLSACRAPTLYDWGGYEESVHCACTDFQGTDLPKHVAEFAARVEKSETQGRRVPPGVHAHLGYLYSLVGDNAAAGREIALERERFPESAVFVDGLIARMKR